jgi:hypothetical protein
MGRRRRLVAILAVGVVLLTALAFRLSPMWPGPMLPSGATRLHIVTEPPHLVPAFGCVAAALAPARISVVGDELVLRSVAADTPLRVVWPSGWAAWRLNGRAELLSREGTLIGREGDVLENLGGGTGIDDAFHVCVFGG